MEEYLTIEQLCNVLGIKKSTCYKLSSKNVIPKFKPGEKVILFKANDATKYIESKRIASKEEIKKSVLKKLFE